jgi:hypothetical protein
MKRIGTFIPDKFEKWIIRSVLYFILISHLLANLRQRSNLILDYFSDGCLFLDKFQRLQ